MKCHLCGSEDLKYRQGSVRDNKDLKILECNECGLVFLSSFSHITNQFYEESNMSCFDVQEWLNNTSIDDCRRFELIKERLVNKDILDFGSGAGGFLIYAKKVAKSVTGIELDKQVKQHYDNNKIILLQDTENLKKESYDIITLFHVLEHLEQPLKYLEELLHSLRIGGQIIIEIPNANDALLTIYENIGFQNFTYWSPHLFLYNDKNIRLLLKPLSHIVRIDFIKYIQRYPLSNHLYWLSKNKPGGHKVWSFIDSTELNKAYESQLASMGLTDTLLIQITKL
ncbi:MAG: class I SAM-dependent methyltransferase [Arcobacteraceae bacterium]|jgi:2-polyprenyl-3-methyl-5-hydroxy-6-metoxy-1,4-benzoquinol methylase|nr:class I SAM-dependent methyltransferase [Arcobacteraceae bacterium]